MPPDLGTELAGVFPAWRTCPCEQARHWPMPKNLPQARSSRLCPLLSCHPPHCLFAEPKLAGPKRHPLLLSHTTCASSSSLNSLLEIPVVIHAPASKPLAAFSGPRKTYRSSPRIASCRPPHTAGTSPSTFSPKKG